MLKLTATYLIGKHLHCVEGTKMEEPCALCRSVAHEVNGLPRRDVVDSGFMDSAYLSASKWICIYCAACFGYDQTRTEWIKNSSFLATESALLRLAREEIWGHLLNPPTEPFVFGVTYAHKKHLSFKAGVNMPGRHLSVQTENHVVQVDLDEIASLTPIIHSWYTIKDSTATEPTWFTKSEILLGSSNFKRIEAYGPERYLTENAVIEPFRGTGLLELLCYALNKAPLEGK